MSKVFSFVKPVRWLRILTVFLAGVLLFFSTACSGGVQAKTLDKNPRPEVPDNAVTSPYQGGMNDFSDVDPRADASKAGAKAKGLVDNAEANLQNRADSVEKYVDNYKSGTPLPERVGNLVKSVTEPAKDSAEDFGKGSDRGVRNVKENSQDAAHGIPATVNQAKRNAENTLDDTASAADRIKNTFKDSAQGIADNAKKSADRAAENTKQAFGSNSDRIH